jgi:hypothetical protein
MKVGKGREMEEMEERRRKRERDGEKLDQFTWGVTSKGPKWMVAAEVMLRILWERAKRATDEERRMFMSRVRNGRKGTGEV